MYSIMAITLVIRNVLRVWYYHRYLCLCAFVLLMSVQCVYEYIIVVCIMRVMLYARCV